MESVAFARSIISSIASAVVFPLTDKTGFSASSMVATAASKLEYIVRYTRHYNAGDVVEIPESIITIVFF